MLRMKCPEYQVEPGKYEAVNNYITPNNQKIMLKAWELIAEDGGVDVLKSKGKERIIETCFNFVSRAIKYTPDWERGHMEHWSLPSETLKNKEDDCEGSAFLVTSLSLAVSSLLAPVGFGDKDMRVVLGTFRGSGHAWDEALIGDDKTEDGWRIYESTSDKPLKMGENAWKLDDGKKLGYSPGLHIYHKDYKVVDIDLYNRFPLRYSAWQRRYSALQKFLAGLNDIF